MKNHSGKSVIAALLIFTPADRKPWVQNRLFTHDALGLPNGGSERLGAFSKYQKFESPIVSAKIGAIIFADGEFRGEDSYQDAVAVSIPANFQSDMERHFQSIRNVWMMAKAGNWAGVQAKADAGDWSHDTSGTAVAVRLLEGVDGRDKAVESLKHLGLLPATIWKSGLINKLQFVPNLFQIVAEWISPTVYAQSGPFCCVMPYPQGPGLDAYHPNEWNYACNTPLFGGSNAPAKLSGGSLARPLN